MRRYSLVLSGHVSRNTKINVYELHRNGKSLFEPFVKEVEKEGNLFGHLARAIRIVEETSNLNRYPKTKFRELQDHGLDCKVYEAKSDIVRIYLFHEEKTGRVIVIGGSKNDQRKDIKTMIRIIKEYRNENK